MAIGSSARKSLGVCYLLMASLFALSASFQLNDPEWYFWIPLYASGCVVNLANWASKADSNVRRTAKFAFGLGVFLFIKVGTEGFLERGGGFGYLDMRERIVREKFGSVLVIWSMFLHLERSSSTPRKRPSQLTKYGLPILVATAYGLSFIFFVFQHREMKF